MKLCKLECIIKPFKLEEVKEALTKFGVNGMTVYEVKGFGRQRGHIEIYRGAEYKVDFVPKLKIEIFISEDKVDETIEVVCNTAKTGSIDQRNPLLVIYRLGLKSVRGKLEKSYFAH